MMNKATKATGSELLNIKQAAVFLNVSEISLRRWTDSGKLPCFRIGGKRERRFKQDDLEAFLEVQVDRNIIPVNSSSHFNHKTHILLEGVCIDYGKHICTIYETDLGRIKLSVPFLSEGIRKNDICFLIAADEEKEHIFSNLENALGDISTALSNDNLIISDGMNSGIEMLSYLESEFIRATQAGSRTLRVLGDMSWFLCKGLDLDDLFEFEHCYNRTLASRFPVVSLCQYDARKFSGTSIVHALKCHEDTFQYPLARFIGI